MFACPGSKIGLVFTIFEKYWLVLSPFASFDLGNKDKTYLVWALQKCVSQQLP